MEKGKVLIIDDESDMVDTLFFMLYASNYDVYSALAGSDGLEIAKSGRPDLAIVDIMMPDMDGYEVCRQLRSEDATKNTLIIILSAKTDSEAIQKAYQSGADDYITKPFDFPVLLDKMGQLMSKFA